MEKITSIKSVQKDSITIAKPVEEITYTRDELQAMIDANNKEIAGREYQNEYYQSLIERIK